MSVTAALVEVRGVTRRFGPVVALDAVDVDIRENEFFALLGPSGCGKTTLLQVLAGFLVPDAGEIWLNDELISSARASATRCCCPPLSSAGYRLS